MEFYWLPGRKRNKIKLCEESTDGRPAASGSIHQATTAIWPMATKEYDPSINGDWPPPRARLNDLLVGFVSILSILSTWEIVLNLIRTAILWLVSVFLNQDREIATMDKSCCSLGRRKPGGPGPSFPPQNPSVSRGLNDS